MCAIHLSVNKKNFLCRCMGALGTVGAIGERSLQSQLQETAMNVTNPTASHSAAPSLVLLIGLPLLIVILTAIIVLLLVLAGQSLRHRLQNSDKYQYRSVPTEDTEGDQRPLSLPYPPSVKLKDPPTPTMTFHMATQLSDPATTGSRYPFLQHQQTKRSIYETRPGRLRTRRRGNHKHGRGMHMILNGAEPDPEVLKERLEESKIKKEMEKVVHENTPTPPRLSPSPGYKPHMYHYQIPPEKKSSKAREEANKEPEIFLTLLYNKDTASLVVRVDRVIGLPFRGDGSEVDAYVRLFFIPKVPKLPQRRTSKTKSVARDSSPVFGEEICYEAMSAEELINSTLHIQVLDYRSYGKHSTLGQVDLPLVRVQFEKGEASVTLSLHPPKVWSCLLNHIVKLYSFLFIHMYVCIAKVL